MGIGKIGEYNLPGIGFSGIPWSCKEPYNIPGTGFIGNPWSCKESYNTPGTGLIGNPWSCKESYNTRGNGYKVPIWPFIILDCILIETIKLIWYLY